MILISDNEDKARSRRRTAHAELKQHLADLGIESDTAHLPFGDVSFTGNGPDGSISIGIELKTVLDLVGSMRSNRLLGHQVPGLLEMYDRRYLIVEGIFRYGRRNGLLEVPAGNGWRTPDLGPQPVVWSGIQAFTVGLAEAGIRCHWTRTPVETAKEIETLYRFWQKDYDEHTTLLPQFVKQDKRVIGIDRPNEKWITAAILPGVGWKRARAIAEHFDSIDEFVTAPIEEWQSIEGIGRTIAHDIYEFLHRRSKGAIKAHERANGTQRSQLQARHGAARRSARRRR